MYAYFKIKILQPPVDVCFDYIIISNDFSIYHHTDRRDILQRSGLYSCGPQMIKAIVCYSEIMSKYPVGSMYNGPCYDLEMFDTKEDLMDKYFFEIF